MMKIVSFETMNKLTNKVFLTLQNLMILRCQEKQFSVEFKNNGFTYCETNRCLDN